MPSANRCPRSSTMAFCPVDEATAGKFITIDRDLVRDPWDRFIVATALAFDLPLVTQAGRRPLPVRRAACPSVWHTMTTGRSRPLGAALLPGGEGTEVQP